MRKGRSALPLKPTTKSHLYPTFLVLLPILFTIVVFVGYTKAKLQYYEAGIRDLDKQMNTVFQFLTLFNNQVKDGTLTFPEADRKIKELLAGTKRPDGTRDTSNIRVTPGKGDTIFAFNSQGTLILHPQLEGKNLHNLPNQGGHQIIREVQYEGKTVITYNWQNADETVPQTIIALVRYYPQWDWYVCLASPEENFYEPLSQIKFFLAFLVVGSYVITAVLFYLTRRKEKALISSTLLGEQLVQTNQTILKTLAVALEERDAYTSGHSQRVAYYMRIIAGKMGMDEQTQETIYTGGLLHDIGKIGIEDSILLKPGRLTEEEYEIIKSHPVRGEALLKRLYAHAGKQDAERIKAILTITRSHHERFDGKGYPDRLQGEEIPLFARIAAVADAFDAMTSSRAYRKGFSFSKACDEITRNAGTQFCPAVVEAFLQSVTEETFFHAHQISRANELLLHKFDVEQISIQTVS
jgi:hypothetical protein